MSYIKCHDCQLKCKQYDIDHAEMVLQDAIESGRVTVERPGVTHLKLTKAVEEYCSKAETGGELLWASCFRKALPYRSVILTPAMAKKWIDGNIGQESGDD